MSAQRRAARGADDSLTSSLEEASTSVWSSSSEAVEQSASTSFQPDSLEGTSSTAESSGPETSQVSGSGEEGMTSEEGSLFDFHSSKNEEGIEEEALGMQLGEMSLSGVGSGQRSDEPASSSFTDSLEAQREAIRQRKGGGKDPAPRESTPALELPITRDRKQIKIDVPGPAKQKSRKVVRGPNGKPIFIFTEGNKTRVIGAPSWLLGGNHLDDLSEIDWKWSDEEEDSGRRGDQAEVADDSEP